MFSYIFFKPVFEPMPENQKWLKHSFSLHGVLSLKYDCHKFTIAICDTFMLKTFTKFSGNERVGCTLNG